MVQTATPIEKLQLRLEVKLDALEKGMRQLQGMTARGLKAAERNFSEFERNVERSGARAASGFSRAFAEIQRANIREVLAGVAVFMSAERVIAYADAWQMVSNRLVAAGIAGEEQVRTMGKLYEIAQSNGLAIDDLAVLYSRSAQAAGELGASQAQLEQMTAAVAAAVRVNGGSIEASRGALVQFAQALGSGTVRAEEFNSIQEGARPILQAVARNLEAAGGSVNKLKLLVNEGQVSSEDFFNAFIKGSQGLINQAEGMELTVAQSFTKLENAFTKFVGEVQLSQTLAVPIGVLADNLNELLKIATVLGAAFAAWRIGLLATQIPLTAMTANLLLANTSLFGTAAAAGAATGGITALTAALLANPFVAVTALLAAAATALYVFGDNAETAEQKTKRLTEELLKGQKELEENAGKTKELTDKVMSLNEALDTAKELQKDYADRTREVSAAQAQMTAETLDAAVAVRKLALAQLDAQQKKGGSWSLYDPLEVLSEGTTYEAKRKILADGVEAYKKEAERARVEAGTALKRTLDAMTATPDVDSPAAPNRPDKPKKSRGKSTAEKLGDLIAAARARVEAAQMEATALGMADDAAERYRFTQEVLARAKQQEIPITKDLVEEINRLSMAYGNALAAQDKQENLKKTDEFLAASRARTNAVALENQVLQRSGVEQTRFRMEKELLLLADQKKIILSPDVVESILREAEAYAVATEELKKTEQKQADLEDGMRSLQEAGADAAERLLINFEDVGNVLKDIVKMLASSALRNLITGGQGGLAGGLDSFIGSNIFGRAGGGTVNAGQMYRVNEGGMKEEFFTPKVPGRVGKGQPSNGPQQITIDLRGTTGDKALDMKLAQAVKVAVTASGQQMKRGFGAMLADHQLRSA